MTGKDFGTSGKVSEQFRKRRFPVLASSPTDAPVARFDIRNSEQCQCSRNGFPWAMRRVVPELSLTSFVTSFRGTTQ
jgi:hypothetical protein